MKEEEKKRLRMQATGFESTEKPTLRNSLAMIASMRHEVEVKSL